MVQLASQFTARELDKRGWSWALTKMATVSFLKTLRQRR
jgi:hypothetical protein